MKIRTILSPIDFSDLSAPGARDCGHAGAHVEPLSGPTATDERLPRPPFTTGFPSRRSPYSSCAS